MDELTMPKVGARRWPFALGLIVDPPGLVLAGCVAGVDAGTGLRWAVGDDDPHGEPSPPHEGVWSPGWDAVTSRHLAVALACYRAGYFLLHTLRAGAPNGEERVLGERDWDRLWGLAMRTDADGLFVLGLPVDQVAVLEPLASELRLTLHAVPAPTGRIDLDPDPDTPDVGIGVTDEPGALTGQAVKERGRVGPRGAEGGAGQQRSGVLADDRSTPRRRGTREPGNSW